MGLYIRKSVRVGPFRFNLSKSGVGVSAGIPGFRVGTGPRGNYIHMGRGGLYYRKTFPTKPQPRNATNIDKDNSEPAYTPQIPTDTHGPLREIESGDVFKMVDSSSEALIAELNDKRKRFRLWPFVAISGVIATLYLAINSFADWTVYLAGAFSLLAVIFAAYRDVLSKSVVILYDIEEEFQETYQSLHNAFNQMTQCKGHWHMEAEGRVRDKKYHAGADSIVRRKSISLTLANPPYVKTNVATPSIPVGKQILYFFPDKVLIFEPKGIGAVSYENLSIDITHQKFIEDGPVPSDAKVIDKTWRYVNKRGGPDRRFKDNRELPIALYEDIHFSSVTGLNETIELSRTGVAEPFARAIREVGSANQRHE